MTAPAETLGASDSDAPTVPRAAVVEAPGINDDPGGLRWRLGVPFIAVHLACLTVLVVGISPVAVGTALTLYWARVFGITAFYHRLLSHRAFETSRLVRFLGVFLANSAAQKGPLWWVGNHRIHHRVTEQPGDPHSPRQLGFLRAHTGWQFEPRWEQTRLDVLPDLANEPELRFLDRFHYVAPLALALSTFAFGLVLGRLAPSTGTNGPQMLVWGFFVSTAVLYHVTFAINSVGHKFGRRAHDLRDDSRNSWWLAVLAMGEGWHNNHHRYPASARHGFTRLQIDLTHGVLRVMRRLGLVWDLRPVPVHLRTGEDRRRPQHRSR